MLEMPAIVVNLKAYEGAIGVKAIELCEIIASVGKEKGVSVAVSPQYADLYRITSQVDIPVFAQHVDSLSPGSGTGWLLPEAAKEGGATGSLVNHSEHRIDHAEIEKIVSRLRDIGLESCVCSKDPEESAQVAAFKPDMVAVEPPELIGSGRAVSSEKPDVVSDTVKMVKDVNPDVKVLCGAGVSTGEDVRVSLELGAEGVLLASCVTKADDPRAVMLDLAEGLLKAKK